MLRLVVTTSDIGHMIHAGGEIVRSSKTFDIHLPELEAILKNGDGTEYITASLSYEVR